MREIKFRAWDDGKKEWLLGYELVNLGGFSLYGECVMFGEWGSVADQFIFERNGHNQDDLKVMQYTGLHDRNGTEIYEGDILAFWNESLSGWERYEPDDYDTHDHPRILAVEYKAPEFWFVNGNDTLSGDISSDFVEVIGNIYENSDLLKEEENK